MTKQDFKDHGVSRQAVAAAELVRALQTGDGDEVLIHDMIEGETDFFEAVERALDEINECELVSAGCADMAKKVSDRKGRFDRRAERLRGLIDQAFQLAGVESHKFATATISTKRVPPKLIVTDEASVPSQYYKPQPPKLDLSSLKEAAKNGPVPGAEMSNGGTTIQIRRA